MIFVLDDYSRMIPGWKVQPSMRGGDIIEVVQQAVEFTGQPTVRVGPGPALLTDSGPDFLDKALEKFLKLRVMKHIIRRPTGNWSGAIRASSTR